jgi:hypothetical protein
LEDHDGGSEGDNEQPRDANHGADGDEKSAEGAAEHDAHDCGDGERDQGHAAEGELRAVHLLEGHTIQMKSTNL